ncbi:MAG: glycerol-3-phosphate acyltransferase [Dehalococcoidales bacterium]|nr:glycerol-3-phosphate acyltransferase [Dehalococcoidales bacterium]
MWADFALVAGAYLFGSLPHLPFMARLYGVKLDGDFHQELWYRAGRFVGVLGVIGEFIKGVTPVLVARALDFDTLIVVLAGVAAVCGQMWPVFARFDGEKGNSIAVAVMFALAPVPAAYALTFVIIALIVRLTPRIRARSSGQRIIGGSYSRSLPLGRFACFLSLPILSWALGEPMETVWGLAGLFVLMIGVRRLTAGLKRDLRESRDIRGILLRRLLYDRSTVTWR